MIRFAFVPAALLLAALPLVAQDVYVPPVPIGIAGEGRVRTPQGPIPFPSDKTEWIRVRSPRFDVISSADPDRTRDIVGDLDTLGTALERANPSRPAQTPATVFIFGNRRESQPYFDLLFAKENARATGAYVRHHGGGTMFIDGSRRGRFERTAMHELVHDLLRRNGIAPPLWLEEGLAEYFGNADVRNGRVTAGEALKEHVAILKQKPLMSIDQLLAVQFESDAASTSVFYAQSWAAVDWLMSLNADAFFPFLRDVADGTAIASALQTHYKVSIRDVDVAIRRRDNSTLLAVLKSIAPATTEAEPLPRATVLYELGAFLIHVAGAEKEAQRHFAEALRVDPKHARTLAAIGRFEEAIAAAPNDPHVHLLYAESLLATALGDFAGVFTALKEDEPRFRKARALAEHALTLDPDEARARGILGTTYSVERDLTPGIAQLEKALSLAPQRVDLALNLYAMYLRTGAREKADALYATHFEHAREKQTIFAARNVLVTSETERANALAQSGKLAEAATIVRSLAANTADPAGRRELERQAAQLESTDAVNREITAYNEAIALTNKGKNREALKVLDELLKSATDAEVIRDATALRNELKKMRR